MKKLFTYLIGVPFLVALVIACPKTYVPPIPTAQVGEQIYTLECVGSSTATKTSYEIDEFCNTVLSDKRYLEVKTEHSSHNNDIGFSFEANLKAINTPHQHGTQVVPILIKDSTGVWGKSEISVFINHDKTAPSVAVANNIGEIDFGTAITQELLTQLIMESDNFNVSLNPCASSESKKFSFCDMVYETNVEANQTYTCSFRIEDFFKNKSEVFSTTYSIGANIHAAPEVKQLQDIVTDCENISLTQILDRVYDPNYFEIKTLNGKSFVKPVQISGFTGITSGTHYHNKNLELTGTFFDSEGISTKKTIKVVVNPAHQDPPVNNSFDPNQPIGRILITDNPLSDAEVLTIVNQFINKTIKPQMFTLSECADQNVINTTIQSCSINTSVKGEYPVELIISDSLGIEMTAPLTVKVKVVTPLPDGIQSTVVVDGKELYITHYDAFDSWETLENNWDIGNPGYGNNGDGWNTWEGGKYAGASYDWQEGAKRSADYYNQYRIDTGNPGILMPSEVTFPDGIKGYSGDRYKQPYWSPKAVAINNGQLEIQVYFDPDITRPDNIIATDNNCGTTKGYGLAGAIHSKRQFPCGFFITKLRHGTTDGSQKTPVHWDAWWAESNNPYSRAYGAKELFMPPGGKTRSRRGFQLSNGQIPTVADRGLNGEQVYEFDMYEWVGNGNWQYQVIHAWSWYGGYTGNEQRLDAEPRMYSTADGLRQNDKNGMNGVGMKGGGYSDGGQAASGNWFYLAMLVTPDKIQMWNSPIKGNYEGSLANPVSTCTANRQSGAFGNNNIDNIWPADEWCPIQVKYSCELGQWTNDHMSIYNKRTEFDKNTGKKDIMYAEFFAFYAWDTSGKYPIAD